MSGAVSALRAIASGTVAAPQYIEFVDKANKKAEKELESLKKVKFDDPILETENRSHQKKFNSEVNAFLEHYPYIRTLSHQLASFQVMVHEENEWFQQSTTVVSQDELSKLLETSDEYSAKYYHLLTAIYEASAFAQIFFKNVNDLNPIPLTFCSIERELGKLRTVVAPITITVYVGKTNELQIVKRDRYQAAGKLSAQVDKTMKVINKNLIKVIEKLGLYMQTVFNEGVPLKNQWFGSLQSPLTKYSIPVPDGFSITLKASSSSSSSLSSKVSSVLNTSTSSSTTSFSTPSDTSKELENKRKEPLLSKDVTSKRVWNKKEKEKVESVNEGRVEV